MIHAKTYVYGTGGVAKICNLSIPTICRLFDSGDIKGYKSLKRGDRKIPEKNLVEFMMKENIPIPLEIKERYNRCSGFGITTTKSDSFVFFKEESFWWCVRPNFVSVEESIAGYGITLDKAHADFIIKEIVSLMRD